MSDTLTLAAETRDRVGKGASRSLRREGRVPAVIYGQNREPTAIHLEEKALVKALSTGHFFTTVVTLNGQRTLPKDVTFHPVTDRPIHVDFLRIRANETVTVQVPVTFVDEDESVYLKQGGVLNVVRHEIEVTCEASSIPTEITISLKGREIGDSIHISDVALPNGVEPSIDDRDFTVATIVPPTVPTAEDEALDAEVAEAQAAEHAEEEAAAEAEAEAEAAENADEGEKKEG
jgi:large subunit ribosomal protein L25